MTGEYLTFADGDDWLELDYIDYLVNILESNECEMAMTNAIFTTRDRKQNNSDKIESEVQVGSTLNYQGISFEVTEMDSNRIKTVLIRH